MENNKILIIKKYNKDVFFNDIPNVERYYSCSADNIIFKILYKINSPLLQIFYDKWKDDIRYYDKVILFDMGFNKEIAKYIKSKNRNIKVVLWYWNSLIEHGNTPIQDKMVDEIWTYNRFDAKKYNLKYNQQFYFKTRNFNNVTLDTDVLFVGREKGREQRIDQLQDILKKNGVNTNFKLIKSDRELISYDSYLNLLEKSKCVLDYSFILPCGLSLRPLEALFYERKLITNNVDIKNYSFYDSNNIFIIGEDNFERINEFINTPYKKIDEKIIEFYSFNSWLNRFQEEENEH